MKALRMWRRLIDRALPTRHLTIVRGDSLPSTLPRRNLVLAHDEEGDWCVGMRCPCGCGYTIELMLIREVTPRWDLSVDAMGRPTIYPSVWLQRGCRSHFWLRGGRVQWCD